MNRFSLVAASLLAGIVALIFKIVRRRQAVATFKRENACAEPKHLPQPERFIGWANFKDARRHAAEHKGLEVLTERFTKVGETFQAVTLGVCVTFTTDPENLKAVLATKFNDFGLGQRLAAFGPLLGKGIFTTDGSHWEHSRAMLRPSFSKTQFANLDVFEEHVQELIGKIPIDGATVDLQHLFFNMTLDSSTETLFGESIHAQRSAGHGGDADRFSESFDYAQEQLPLRSRLGPMLKLHRDAKFFESCKTVHEFVDRVVHRALQTRSLAEKSPTPPKPDGSKQRYVFLEEVMNATSDPQQLRDEALNILLAGRDTTAGLLSNLFHCLARHPQAWSRLRQEVGLLDGEAPTYERLRDMKYLKWVMNETLRLYPSVPANGRFATKDTFLPRGGGPNGDKPVFIPKGGLVLYCVYAMHRRADIFGDDSQEFRPERWSPDIAGGPLRPAWGYLPFNGGARTCLGQQYALTEAMYTTVRLLQTFSNIENRDDEPWRECVGLTLSSFTGTKVSLQPI